MNNARHNPSRDPAVAWVPTLAGGYALLGGLVTLLGWITGNYRLTDWENDGISMKANAAICSACCGAAMLIYARTQPTKGRMLTTSLGALVAVVGGLTLCQHLTGWNFGIDTLLFNEPPGAMATFSPGRMGVPGSTSFLLLGTALICLQHRRRRALVSPLGVGVGFIVALSMLGYFYGAQETYSLRLTGIALQTASILLALSLGIIASVPEREPMRLLRDPGVAGKLARKALPLIIIIPLLLGGVRISVERAGLMDSALATTFRTLAEVGLFCSLLWLGAGLVRAQEARLRDSEEFSRTVLESNPDCVKVLDADGRIISMNTAGLCLMEIDNFEDFRGKDWQSLWPEKDRALIGGAVAAAKSGAMERFRAFCPTAKGTAKSWDVIVAPVRDDQGRIIRLVSVSRDITDAQLAEEARRESDQRARLATEATGVGIWEWNIHTNKVRWDVQMFRIYGVIPTSDGLVDYSTWSECVVPEDLPHQEQIMHETIRQRGSSRREFRIRRAGDGECRIVQAVETVRTDEAGNTEWIVGTNLDITERQHAADALRAMDRRKNEFLATLAHELRNPLAPVRNAVRILQTRDVGAAELDWSRDVIDRQTQHLTRLIDDLMDVSRISLGRIELKREPLELARIVQGAVEASRPLIDAVGHQLSVHVPSNAVMVNGDLTRLTQVFLNLLNNAAKYTDRDGKIELRAEQQGSDIVISVQDSGIGIPAENLPTIFEMFSQVQGALSRSQGGLGIGLSLVKRLVELHGGTIAAESDGSGRGSRFTVRLPVLVEQTFAPKAKEADSVPRSALKILVVDDHRDSASSLAMLLKMMGNSVRVGYDGQEAVDLAGEFRPDVILCDIGLPRLNGYEAARAIRTQEWGAQMILIAVTGWGQDEDKRLSDESGFDHHLVKPVDPQRLMEMLADLNAVKR